MKNHSMQGVFAGLVAITMAVAAHGQQSTPQPATDFAPAAPGNISATPQTTTAAPAAGVTSGREALESGDRANEQSAETAGASSTATSNGLGTPSSAVPPPAQPGSPLDRQLGSGTDTGANRASADTTNGAATEGQIATGQRGELGVWLVESGGPGVRVRRVTEGSAAAQAGIQPGDVVLAVNGQGATSAMGVAQLIRQIPAGQTATVQIWRDGQTSDMQIVLQPMREQYREQYEVGFRGDESLGGTGRPSGDLESRTVRLEQQLTIVMQELRALRQEMAQLRGGSQTSLGSDLGAAPGDATNATTPAATATQPSGTPAGGATPATEPTPAAEPATPAAPSTENDDLFGGSPTEEPAATPDTGAAPGNETTPATTPAESNESDDLFK
jgi:hypothetical protein